MMDHTKTPRRRLAGPLCILFLGLLLVSCGSSESDSDWTKGLGYKETDAFDITYDGFGSPKVPVVIDNTHLDATFDTGNLVGLMVSTELATNLDLRVTGTRPLLSASGDPVGEMHLYHVDSLKLFNYWWTDVTASEYTSNAVQAMIGPKFLVNSRFTIDYPHRRMAVSTSPTPDTVLAGESTKMIVSSRFPEMILVAGTINGSPTVFVVKTGEARSSIDPLWAQLLRLGKSHDGYRIDNITIAGHTFSVPSAEAERFIGLEQGINRAIKASIGADILADLRITADYNQRLFYIYQEPAPEAEPGT